MLSDSDELNPDSSRRHFVKQVPAVDHGEGGVAAGHFAKAGNNRVAAAGYRGHDLQHCTAEPRGGIDGCGTLSRLGR